MATVGEIAKRMGLIDTTAAHKKHAASSWEQVTGLVGGVIPGAIGMVAQGAKNAIAVPRTVYDAARGDASIGDVAGAAIRGVPGSPVGLAEGFVGHRLLPLGNPEKYEGAQTDLGASFRNTAEDVRHPTRFKQASDEGRILAKLVEDAGNVSIAGMAAAPVLAGLGEGSGPGARLAARAAPIAGKVESLGAKAVDAATVGPYRYGLRKAGKLAQAALETAPETNKFATSAARLLDPVLRSEKRLASEGNVQGYLAGERVQSNINELRKGAGSDAAFEASVAQLTGLDAPIREAVAADLHSNLPAIPGEEAAAGTLPVRRPDVVPGFDRGKLSDELLATLYPNQLEGYGVRPEVGRMLADYHAGTLDPEVAAKIEETTAKLREIKDADTLKALGEGSGFSGKGSLNPEQLGTAPLTDSGIGALENERARVGKKTQEAVDVAGRKLRRAEVAERVPEDFSRSDVQRTVLAEGRRNRAYGKPTPGTPALPGEVLGPDVAAADLGARTAPESLVRGVTRRARVEGEALGLAKAADDAAGRASRRPSTTLVDVQRGEGAAAVDRAGKLGWRQTQEGRLSERARQASADAEAALVGMPEQAKTVTRQQAQEAHALDQANGGSEGWADLAGMKGARKVYEAIDAETRLSDAYGNTGAAQDTLTGGVDRAIERGAAVGREQGATAQLQSEAGLLGRRAENAYERAQATGDLHEEALKAQAKQAGDSFAAGRRAEQTSTRRRTAQQGLTAAQDAQRQALEHIDGKLNAARANPQSYPARWRPAMEGQIRWVEHLRKAADAAGTPHDKALLTEMVADVPLLPEEMQARGLDPRHVTTGYLSDVTRDQTASRLTTSLAPERKLAAENQRASESDVPTSAKALARRESQQATYRVHNDVVQALLEPMQVDAAGKAVIDVATNTPTGYSRSAESVLGREGLDQILQDARAKAQGEKPGNGAHARRLQSEAVFEAMRAKGWEAFDPTGSGGDGRFGLPAAMVNPETTAFLKRGSASMLDNYLVPKNMNLVLQAAHYINTRWKGAVLPFSLRWQIGDAVGNALMAWAGGGITPLDLYRHAKAVKAAAARGEIPDRVAQHGLALDAGIELGLRDAPRAPRTVLGKAYKGFQGKAFALNETINRLERSAFYLAKLEEFGGKETAGAAERAIRESNRVMGDFSNMAPWEKRYLTQVFPFWSWMRHITRLTGAVAIDNPARMVHMLRLSALYADDQVDLPDWAKGGLPIGNNLVIPLRGLEPFGDVTSGPAIPVSGSGGLGTANAFRAMSPAIMLAAAGLTGRNLKRESWDLSTPTKNKRTDQYGRAVPTPLIRHPAELASYAADLVPILRTARDLAPSVGAGGFQGGPALRYDTGETRTKGHKAMKPDQVLGKFGVPDLGGRGDVVGHLVPFFPQAVNAKQQKAIAARRRRS